MLRSLNLLLILVLTHCTFLSAQNIVHYFAVSQYDGTMNGQLAIAPKKLESHKGSIKGQVLNKETKAPLIGVNVMLKDTKFGTATDSDGRFLIENVPVGSYVVQFKYIGYESVKKTDVIIKSNRIAFLNIELSESAVIMEDIVVTGGYFSNIKNQPTGAISFSGEEIRRSPGSSGDISRILSGLASVAKVNEQDNSLIVRGGNPIENGFYIDNIEVPNINHYPIQGSTGGALGLVNVDFIQDVNFSAGGFSAAYGDKLSSITNIKFREGNSEEIDAQLDLSMTGFGIAAEGPLPQKKGSYLFSVRRSYMDLMADALGLGIAPRYSDYQGKLVYSLSQKHKISILGLVGDDFIEWDKETAKEWEYDYYAKTKIISSTIGADWRYLWNSKGYSNTAVSVTSIINRSNITEYITQQTLFKKYSDEKTYNLRNVNFFRFNPSLKIEFGFDAKHIINQNNNYYGKFTNSFGEIIPSQSISKNINANKIGIFNNIVYNPIQNLTTTLGLRYDYFSYNDNTHFSPRLSCSYKLSKRTTINGSIGVYYQNLPLILLSQNSNHKNLDDPKTNHIILGIEHLLTDNTKLTFEIYNKSYDKLPLDPAESSLLILDELFYRSGYSSFFSHENLIDNGKAYCRGLELILQKKLAANIYGTMSLAYFKTRYRGYDDIWRDRTFDNEYIIGVDCGYKPNKNWEFSIKWNYAGGIPYTPFDIEASQALYRAVFDEDKVNQARYPAYHSMNIRADRRFHFRRTNLICYFDLYNVYNRKNVVSYIWNVQKNEQSKMKLWGTLPVLGVEFEF